MSPRSLRRTLAAYRAGGRDPTTRFGERSFLHATLTPDGPGTLRIGWQRDPAEIEHCGIDATAWGPGAGWLLARVDAMTGVADREYPWGLDPAAIEHPLVVQALRRWDAVRVGASGNLYHLLLPTIIAQRILAREALVQWGRLCRALGGPAPGPADVIRGLRLPPDPPRLANSPTWWFHPLGIEVKRASTLIAVARRADQLWSWAEAGPATARHRLLTIPGVGEWTVGSVLGPALGDPDAVPVGDFHLPNIVAWNLAGEPRADDARMLELLAPFAGQRGRVLKAIASAGSSPPGRGPRVRTPDMRTW